MNKEKNVLYYCQVYLIIGEKWKLTRVRLFKTASTTTIDINDLENN